MVFGFFERHGAVTSTERSLPKALRADYRSLLGDYLSLRGTDVEALQCKAYEMLWDSIQASSYVTQMNALTINTGLNLEASPNLAVLGLDAQGSQEWANKTESFFRVWQNAKESDHTKRNNFRQQQISAFMSWMVFGEFFAILRYSTDSKRLNPISIKIKPHYWLTCPPKKKRNYHSVSVINKPDSIEISAKGEEVALYLTVTDVNGGAEAKRFPFKGAKSGKLQVLHGYETQEPGQYRGIPKLAKVFQELKKIADAQVFELASMAANATILGSIERERDVVNNEKLKGLGNVGFGLSAEATAACASSNLDAKDINISKGGLFLQNLEPGEKLKSFDSTRPNLNIPEFINQIMEWVGPSIGLPASVWKMQFSSNYSASKGELELAWRNMDVTGMQFSSDFNQPVYESWLDGEIANGNIVAPGWDKPYAHQAWATAVWTRIPIPALNPLQEAKASTELLAQGLSHREHEAQRRTGTSFADNVSRLKIENEELAEANSSITEEGDPSASVPLDPEEEE